MVKASTPEPFSTSRTSNWVARRGGLPPYVQHIAHDLMEDPKHPRTESEAIRLAIGIVENPPDSWDATAKAAAKKAAGEWKAKRGASKVSEARRAAPKTVPLAAKVSLRRAATARLRAIEEAFSVQMMLTLMEASTPAWSPDLKRTASAGSEGERFEVHHEGQQVGTLASRRGYRNGARPIMWNAKSINGRMVSDTEDSKQAALTALRKHLEAAPARVAQHTDGKWLVAEPESYGGQVKYGQFPSESAARYSAGLPEKESAPERASKVVALGEMIAFDVATLGAFDALPREFASLAETIADVSYAAGDRVNYQHPTAGRVGGTVAKVTSRHVHVRSSDPRVSPARMTHREAKSKLSLTKKAPVHEADVETVLGSLLEAEELAEGNVFEQMAGSNASVSGQVAAERRKRAGQPTPEDFNKKHPRGGKGSRQGGKFVRKGSSGTLVKEVQKRLGVAQTGSFAFDTVAAVKSFQRERGLQVDGVVGAQTAQALLGNRNAKVVKPGALSAADAKALGVSKSSKPAKAKKPPKGKAPTRIAGGVAV
jgi:peptidoglycan hydrolase-like protein with peptidoglycan-binding domain